MDVLELARQVRARIDGGMKLALEDVLDGIDATERATRTDDIDLFNRIELARLKRVRREAL